MSPFETILLEEVARLKRALLAKDESLSGFTLEITATGRLDGDVSVSFKLGDYYGLGSVSAGALASVAEEFLRRRGWQERHGALCLPNVSGESTQSSADDEIPF